MLRFTLAIALCLVAAVTAQVSTGNTGAISGGPPPPPPQVIFDQLEDCPYRVTIAVDVSGSIYQSAPNPNTHPNVILTREALTGLVTLLNYTETELRIVKFGTFAQPIFPVPGGSFTGHFVNMRDPAALPVALAAIANVNDDPTLLSFPPSYDGWTNWEDALLQSTWTGEVAPIPDGYDGLQAPPSDFRDKANLIIMITDGRPTTCNDITLCPKGDQVGSQGGTIALNKATAVRDRIEATQQIPIIPIGVGNIRTDNLIRLATCAPSLCTTGQDYLGQLDFVDLLNNAFINSLLALECCLTSRNCCNAECFSYTDMTALTGPPALSLAEHLINGGANANIESCIAQCGQTSFNDQNDFFNTIEANPPIEYTVNADPTFPPALLEQVNSEGPFDLDEFYGGDIPGATLPNGSDNPAATQKAVIGVLSAAAGGAVAGVVIAIVFENVGGGFISCAPSVAAA